MVTINGILEFVADGNVNEAMAHIKKFFKRHHF
jgi:hypothetical protein